MAFTIGTFSTTRTVTGVTTNTATHYVNISGVTGLRYYTARLMANGGTIVQTISSQYLPAGSGYNFSAAVQDTTVLTGLNGATSLGMYFTVIESSATNGTGTVYTTTNTAVQATTINPRVAANAASLDNFDLNTGGTQSITWVEPSAHAGWRTYFYLASNGITTVARGWFSTASNTLTLAAEELAEFKNLINPANNASNVTLTVYTGWQLSASVTTLSGTSTDYATWSYVMPAVNSTTTNDRYKNLAAYNGTAWVNPSEVFVYNGTAWESYGNSANGAGKDIMIYNGSAWNRATLNITGTTADYGTSYEAATKKTGAGSNTGLVYTYANITVDTKRVYYTWESWLSEILAASPVYGWAGTGTGNDNTEDYFDFYWKTIGPKWIDKVSFRGANTTYYDAAPFKIDVAAQYANGVWYPSGASTPPADNAPVAGNYVQYTIPTGTYTAALDWGDYFTLNLQDPQGFVGMRIRIFNNTGYHTITQSTRFAGINIALGDITQTPQWG